MNIGMSVNQLASLEISYCDEIEIIPQLNLLTYFSIEKCDKITPIFHLNHIKSLIVWNCNQMKSIRSTDNEDIKAYLNLQIKKN